MIPIQPLLKRSLLLILLIGVLTFCGMALGQGIGLKQAIQVNPAVGGIFILSGAMWIIYQGLKDQYKDLETAPTIWLVLLSIGSLLSSTTFSIHCINTWTQTIPCLLKINNLYTYALFIQCTLCDVVINGVMYYMVFHTIKSLKQKLLD